MAGRLRPEAVVMAVAARKANAQTKVALRLSGFLRARVRLAIGSAAAGAAERLDLVRRATGSSFEGHDGGAAATLGDGGGGEGAATLGDGGGGEGAATLGDGGGDEGGGGAEGCGSDACTEAIDGGIEGGADGVGRSRAVTCATAVGKVAEATAPQRAVTETAATGTRATGTETAMRATETTSSPLPVLKTFTPPALRDRKEIPSTGTRIDWPLDVASII